MFKHSRFPPQSPLKPLPVRPPVRDHRVPRIPRWDDFEEIPVPDNIPMKPLVMVKEHWTVEFVIIVLLCLILYCIYDLRIQSRGISVTA